MSSHAWGITGYSLLLGVLVAIVAISRRPSSSVSTGGRLILSVRRTRAGRILLVLIWWWVGWHVFVR